jgi:hypothetical protein
MLLTDRLNNADLIILYIGGKYTMNTFLALPTAATMPGIPTKPINRHISHISTKKILTDIIMGLI